jgi:protein-S-isoprenylcysteine O-methyltransferase Ste14
MAMARFPYKLISIFSLLIGSISLIIFLSFVLFGPLNLIDLELGNFEAMLINTFLSLMFFLQHSLIIRDSIRNKIIKIIPSESFYAFHSIVSGTTLLLAIILWQKSTFIVISITEPYIPILRLLQFISILGLIWGVKSLSNFDPFGRKQISKFIKNEKEAQENNFVYRGPYKIIRHPFYFFILIMIWSHPTLSMDRLLFVFLWTIWIVIGTFLEERDLVNQIGNEYLEYKKKVPMLIPYKIFNKTLI